MKRGSLGSVQESPFSMTSAALMFRLKKLLKPTLLGFSRMTTARTVGLFHP